MKVQLTSIRTTYYAEVNMYAICLVYTEKIKCYRAIANEFVKTIDFP